MPKGNLSYTSREACIKDAKNKGMSDAPCMNLPSSGAGKKKGPGTFQPKKLDDAATY
tara:strand:- start:2116 stop:2286 length:171 start_codon:yes stop_codon:yes gene_type:complete